MSYSQSCYISTTQILGLQGWPENTRNEWDEEQGEAKLSDSITRAFQESSLAWELPSE